MLACSTVMDPTEHSQKKDEQTFMTRMLKGAIVGLVPGIFWGTLAAAIQVEPPVGTTLKIIGKKGLLCAGTGVVYVGVKQIVEEYRIRRDVMNNAVGGLAGATFLMFSQVLKRRHEGRMFHIACISVGIMSLGIGNAQYVDDNSQGVKLMDEINILKSGVGDRMDKIINLQEEKLTILGTMEKRKKEGG